MKRPAGIMLLLSIHLLGAAVFGFIALIMFALTGEATSGTTFNTDIAQGLKPFIAGMGLVLGIGFLLLAAMWLFLGISLWRLKNWARIIAMVLSCANLFLCGTGSLFALFNGWVLLLLLLLISCAVNFWTMWYLLRPHVKLAYGAKGFYV